MLTTLGYAATGGGKSIPKASPDRGCAGCAPKAKLFDSHAHLNEESLTEEERAERAASIGRSDVVFMMDIGFDEPSSVLAVEHAKRYPWCYAVIGMHPHDSKLMDEAMYERFRAMVLADRDPSGDNTLIKAIGEIGLDYHYDLSPRDTQRLWFRRQIRLANELKMPLVIHSREADRETMDILIEEGAFSDERKSWFPERTVTGPDGTRQRVPDPRVDIHCYSGSAEFAREYIKLGATFGVDGPITYKNNKKTVEVVETVPLEYLMIETDAPYLSPVPFRGEPNRSEYVEHVARKIAEIKGIGYEEVAKATFLNAVRFFNIL